MPKTGCTETKLSKPKVTDKSRVVSAIIRSSGQCVQLRMLTNNIKSMTTKLVKGKKIYCRIHLKNTYDEYIVMKFTGEIESLCSDGYGILITKEDMIADSKMPKNHCSTV